ncbi:endonuclease/exonuclease/phosphatase family protein [Rickettsiales endosymbiont of Stachyamoeba lipophora]|uniref:endonuclease/exonuclease/phosphatase family protein n=1 Tax=Rickettsiales endosymbiont of Stachyamoeba lipophora TaxID=2486578 RepID=UPI000F655A2C|nr:endonuclease/exonuclease/phosphatase family protein [Rickettsiales endosymbiont of Stachyamoeba lipophora]AZL15492.1 endonuclease/exonuclease/phosphatase family protein [Rickettsiales endosymbiont of Stachyamoeba lipophora]
MFLGILIALVIAVSITYAAIKLIASIYNFFISNKRTRTQERAPNKNKTKTRQSNHSPSQHQEQDTGPVFTGGNLTKLQKFQANILQGKLSDHLPQIYEVDGKRVLSFNIMNKCSKFQNGGFNNGFGIIENDSQYQQRISKLSDIIAEMRQSFNIDFICLQEAPTANNRAYPSLAHNKLGLALADAQQTNGTSSGLMTFYNIHKFHLQHYNQQPQADPQQQGRFITTQFQSNHGNQPFNICNVHLASRASRSVLLDSYFNQGNGLKIMVGDHNQDYATNVDRGLSGCIVAQLKDTNMVYNPVNGKPYKTTADALIAKGAILVQMQASEQLPYHAMNYATEQSRGFRQR